MAIKSVFVGARASFAIVRVCQLFAKVGQLLFATNNMLAADAAPQPEPEALEPEDIDPLHYTKHVSGTRTATSSVCLGLRYGAPCNCR